MTARPYYDQDGIVIYHGGCRDVMASLAPVDLIMTDPPYSLSVSSDHENKPGRGTRTLDFFAGDRDWPGMTSMVVESVHAACLLSSAAYVWCGHRQFGAIVDVIEALGWKTRPLAWSKKCPIPAPPGVGWDSALEMCVYGFGPGRKWTPPTGKKCPNVLVADSYRHGQPGKVAHPTQKPLILMARPMEYSTDAGDTVLDPFMGSGTTLCAARDLGRRAIGIEIEERYCEVAAKRLAQGVLDFDPPAPRASGTKDENGGAFWR